MTYTVLGGSATSGLDYGGIYTGQLLFAREPDDPDLQDHGRRTTRWRRGRRRSSSGCRARRARSSDLRSTAVLTIVDNDAGGAFKFTAASYSASEASAFVNVTVTRSSGSASNGKVRIRTVTGGTAVPGTDYVALDEVLDFAAGQPSPDRDRSRS